ncbi:MAG: TPM domain-containing protein [Scytonema sp. PMC 1069.18]|nr:TPM domain-containing protein [Scytonema sp. PMC 1069.18]MEC4879734.1 TPM domain-containing protein [Scytonema sp. PMC 1070.18]
MTQLLKQLFSWTQSIHRLILPLVAIALASSILITPASATGVYQMPSLTPGGTWVVDEGEVISRINEGKISSEFENLAKQTGKEVRLVTIRRLDYGETAESFTKELFETWFPSKEAQANKAILMLDTVTNNSAIVTGDEVKTVMSDEIAQSVASETLLLPLRNGNKYNQAFLDACDRIVTVLSGETDPGPPDMTKNVQVEGTFTKAEDTDQGNATAWVVGLLIAATIIPMATYYIYQINQPSSNG